jgi:lipoprotein-releasing system ATP-binding protein
MNKPILACVDVHKTYRSGPAPVTVLAAVNFSLNAGESVAIVGASGSGKSTLLHCLGGLDHIDQGEVQIQGVPWSKLADRDATRNEQLGFIYQFHHLIAELTALDNVALPLRIRRLPKAQAHASAQAVLAKVGLTERALHLPSELSGGERQRVAIARALVTQPACILADEPTGNLDSSNAKQVMRLLLDCAAEQQTALVLVTHALELAANCQRQLTLKDGALVPLI